MERREMLKQVQDDRGMERDAEILIKRRDRHEMLKQVQHDKWKGKRC